MTHAEQRALDLLQQLASAGGPAPDVSVMTHLSEDQRKKCAALALRAGLVRRESAGLVLTETGRAAAGRMGGGH